MRDPRDIFSAWCNRFTQKAHRGSIGMGLIGIGGWGAANAASLMQSRRFNIVGVQDIDPGASARFAARFSTKCYADRDELLADADIQAVGITVPNPFHSDWVKAAADAGKHIFIEKPLASRPEDCKELGQYCQDRQVILQVGHQMRRQPVFGVMKRILDGGSLGRPLFAQAVHTLDRRSRNDWRNLSSACPGGSMEQLGVHLIDTLIYLLGRPLASQGWRETFSTRAPGADWCHVSMSFDPHVHGVVSTSFSCARHFRLELFLEGGRLVTDGQSVTTHCGAARPGTRKPRGLSGSVRQFLEFADCIERGLTPETGAMEATAVMEVVQSMFKERSP